MAQSQDNPHQEEHAGSPQEHETFADRFFALVHESADLFWLLTPDGSMHDATSSWRIFTGQQTSQSQGKGWLDALHPADRPQIEHLIRQAAAKEGSRNMVCHLRQADHAYHLIHLHVFPVRLRDGTIHEVIACGRDITKQEQGGQMSEAKVRLALKASGIGAWDWNLITDQIHLTAQGKALLGWSPTTPSTYTRFLATVHPEDREPVERFLAHVITEPMDYRIEYRILWPDGSIHWLAEQGHCISDSQGHPTHMLGAIIETTKLKQAEEALRESEWRFRRLVESNIIGIAITCLDGRIYEANDAFLRLVGYTSDDLVAGQVQWTTMTPPEYQEREAQAMEEELATGSFQPFEKEYLRKDGTRVPVLVGGTIFRRTGTSPLAIAFIVDLTAHKEIERQKDLMLGMTSHELKTPLAALKGTIQLLKRRANRLLRSTDPLAPEIETFLTDLSERLATSARQVDVQTHLINDLLDVSRITAKTLTLELERCDLVSLVRETVEGLRVVAPERSLMLELPAHVVANVLADQTRISQVVMNYVTNALRYAPVDQPVQIGLMLQENLARVWVRDRGPGLSKEAQKEVWQCFHQVKGVPVQNGSGKGLGLGLYICQKLIAQHQGEVGVESAPGEGSTFWFALPLTT
ncbi:PAS domain-containing sensor histidine kinase [Ktedonospora formicarum]|uniref:histidine kinase n=1 Tax=Ktedonospora formicarum TaxID=2778364 RepID=A0A8J3HWK3_9CHLR|nr:PAS domain-containing sensor histidine kinase [Ktedonospora formicarum]GHO42173.1 hybrid sensor histidine kinase/response regulator [Ktedonospora formicarum]